jgi:UDP-N-acetylmuramate dehydrogenase
MQKIQSDVPLSDYTTFKIGGRAKYFICVKSIEDLSSAIIFSRNKNLPFFVLGGGSNILVSDNGFDGVVIKMEIMGVDWKDVGENETEIVMGAGENWDSVVDLSVQNGFSGLENLSGIPGTVGAGPVQNIGAYGSEIKDTLSFVEVFDTQNMLLKKMFKEECFFDYRDSIFKKKDGARFIIVRVACLLSKNAKPNILYKDLNNLFSSKKISNPSVLDVRNAVLEIRKTKLPDLRELGTAGSFFKNPVVSNKNCEILKKDFPEIPIFDFNDHQKKISAAWILDNVCKYKGYREGNVGVYKNQSLVIVNFGGGTAKEIKNLANKMSECVEKNTNVKIFPEIIFLD